MQNRIEVYDSFNGNNLLAILHPNGDIVDGHEVLDGPVIHIGKVTHAHLINETGDVIGGCEFTILESKKHIPNARIGNIMTIRANHCPPSGIAAKAARIMIGK